MQNIEEPFYYSTRRCESDKIARILCIAAGLKKLNRHGWYHSYKTTSKSSQEVKVLYTLKEVGIITKALLTRKKHYIYNNEK